MRVPWGSNVLQDALIQGLDYFAIVPYIENSSWKVYSYVLYGAIGIVALFNILMIYVSYKTKHAFTGAISLLQLLVQLFKSILFIPVLELFSTIFRCVDNQRGGLMLQTHEEIECWGGDHIQVLIPTGIFALVFVWNSLIAGMLFYERR